MLKTAKKFLLAFPKDKSGEVSKALGKLGVLEMQSITSSENAREYFLKKTQEVDYKISSLEFAINQISQFAKKESFFKSLKVKKPKYRDLKAQFNSEKRLQLLSMIKRLEKIEKRFDVLSREQKEKKAEAEELSSFLELKFVPQETSFTESFIVLLPDTLLNEKNDIFENIIHIKKNIYKGLGKECKLFIILKENKNEFLKILKTFKGEIYNYRFSHSPSQEMMRINEELESITKEIDALGREKVNFLPFLFDFKVLLDLMKIEKAKIEIELSIERKEFLNYLVFWAFENDLKKIEKKISSISKEAVVLETKLDENEEPRVILENNRFIKPFQYVTEIFGMPRSGELDPTPYLAFFFILFFGICLTDAGYGILMMIFTILPILFLKGMFKDDRLIKLLFYGGISTFIMGVLFGSYFGAPTSFIEKFPILMKLKMIDPIEDTVLFMMIAFGLGFLQVFFAQIVKIISGVKNSKKDMLINGIGWAFFYCAMILYFITSYYQRMDLFGKVFLTIGIIEILLVESMGIKVFLKPLVGAIKVLQGLIGTLSDVLSYSRLVALGLATAVIALIVNQIAFLLGDMIPVIGWLVTAIVLIGGHIFNVGINALGSFIHSGRLQFVEFFPKFLEGGGKRFKPVKPDLQHIEL